MTESTAEPMPEPEAEPEAGARTQELLLAASMYYLQDYTMDAIGRRLGTSRSTVSRLLKRAREQGIVSITLRNPDERRQGVAQAVRDAFGVEAHVVFPADDADELAKLEQVALASARLIGMWMDSDMALGVAWGTTTSAIARHLQPKSTRDSLVVQLNGAANTRTSGISYVGSIVSRFAEAFDAALLDFPVPAFFDFAETKNLMWRERSIRRVLDAQARLDIALFSVGAIAGVLPSHVYAAGYLDPGDTDYLNQEGVVGDVCTVFLRADGSYEDIELNSRASGPTPAQLRSIPRRLCAVAGDNKVPPLLAALRAGVATDLVIDDLTAAHLLKAI
jgi:DNA-binding transcriptional regulator LsrR (DeoR family)